MKGILGRWLAGMVLWALVMASVSAVLLLLIYGIGVLVALVDWPVIKGVTTWFVWMQLWWSIGAWFRAKRRKA